MKSAASERVEELKRRIADLKKRFPAHSIPPAMMNELDDLEEQLEQELKKSGSQGGE